MADANPSRPVPQRNMREGKVALPEGAELIEENDNSEQEVSDVESNEPATPKAVKVLKVGQFNERGAQVALVGKMWKSGAVRVDYK